MSSTMTRAGQKWKEFWGSQITKNPQLEDKKSEVNELNNYFQMTERTINQLSQCHSQMQIAFNQCAMIITKIFEHETGKNKQIGTNLIKMFQKVSDIYGEKIQPIHTLKNELQQWFSTMGELKILNERYDEDRLVYDHYKIKIDDLKNSKDGEKITRNERKFEKSQTQYQNICIDIIGRIDKVLLNKFDMINKIVSNLIYIQADLTAETHKYYEHCLNFENEFEENEEHEKKHQNEENENNFINKTRKMLSLPIEQKQQKQNNQIIINQKQQNEIVQKEINPEDEFNKAYSQVQFNDAESPALNKDFEPQIQQQKEEIMKQQYFQQQQQQYQNLKKDRKQIDQQSQIQNNNNIQTQQSQTKQQSQQLFQNPFVQQTQSLQQSILENNNQNMQDPQKSQFKKQRINPFDEETDIEQHNQQQQIQKQFQSSSQLYQTNPFLQDNSFEQQQQQQQQQQSQRMFQTYQPQSSNNNNTNPFGNFQPSQQNNQGGKNPFLQ